MSNKPSFEDKMRSKLESYEAPYDKKYWKDFTKAYPSILKTGFWQAWYLPYAFSLLLFALGYWWFAPDQAGGRPEVDPAIALRDTIYLKETIYVKDTLVIKDTLYLFTYAGQEADDAEAGRKFAKRLRPLASANANPVTTIPTNTPENTKAPKRSAAEPSEETSTSLNQASATLLPPVAQTKQLEASGGAAETSQEAVAPTSSSPSNKPAKASAAIAEPDEADDSLAQNEALLANTADLPEIESRSSDRNPLVFFSGGPRITLFSPLGSGNFDTYFGGFTGGGLTLDVGRFTLDAGLQYGLWHNEFDDLGLLSPTQKFLFPAYNTFVEAPDEIEIVSEHLLLPLHLGYELFDYHGLRTRIGTGVLGNYLLGESFLYNFIDTDETFRHRSKAGRSAGFELSHLNAHLGLTYALRQNLEIQTLIQYYHPLRGMGLSGLNPAAISMQFGLNWVIMSR